MTTEILVIGDDFTPAEMLSGAISSHPAITERRDIDLRLYDLTGRYRQGPVGELSEFVGTPDELIPLVSDAHVIVTTFAPIDARVLDAGERLELILCGRGGLVNIDLAAAEERGVEVRNCPGRNANAVSEYVLGLLVCVTRRIPQANSWVRGGEWIDPQEDSLQKPTGPELRGRTLGIIGFGATGRRVASLAEPLGMHIIAHDPFVDPSVMRDAGVEAVSKRDLLKLSDIVTVHVRPTGDGSPVIGADELALMKRGSYLINTSRGVNVDESALVAALEDRHIAGAALDVLVSEPARSDHPLMRHPSVIVTPHTAGVSTDVPIHTARLLAESLVEWLESPA